VDILSRSARWTEWIFAGLPFFLTNPPSPKFSGVLAVFHTSNKSDMMSKNEKPTWDEEEGNTDDNIAWAAITEDAKHATNAEHALPFWQALKFYRKAVGWSMAISLGIIMEGYDTALIGSFFAFPSFQKKYGQPFEGGYQVSAPWQSSLALASTIGIVFGIQANGYLTERYGYRRVLLVAYVLIVAFIFMTFFAPTVEVLLAGEILCGLPWGVFATMGPAYVSEVCPVALRGYVQIYVNLCWVIGQLIASGVLQGLESNTTQWAYRIPFAIQWVWPLPLFCIVYFAPEGPYWLVRKGRLAEAEHALKRLCSKSSNVDIKKHVALMVHTNKLEESYEVGNSYWDCWRGVERRRTEISCFMWANAVCPGFSIASYGTYFYEQAGLSVANAYKLGLGQTALTFVSLCVVKVY